MRRRFCLALICCFLSQYMPYAGLFFNDRCACCFLSFSTYGVWLLQTHSRCSSTSRCATAISYFSLSFGCLSVFPFFLCVKYLSCSSISRSLCVCCLFFLSALCYVSAAVRKHVARARLTGAVQHPDARQDPLSACLSFDLSFFLYVK